MGTELTEINLAGWLQLPPDEQRETLKSLHRTIEQLEGLKKAVHAAMVEQGLEVPGFQIIKGRTTKAFALDDDATMCEIYAIAEQMGIPERSMLRPLSPAQIEKIIGQVAAKRLLIETTGEPTVRMKKEEA